MSNPMQQDPHAPLLVDVGAPPRSLDGPSSDVARNLGIRFVFAPDTDSLPGKIALGVVLGVCVALTAGLLALYIAYDLRRRRALYLPLFLQGRQAEGRIAGARGDRSQGTYVLMFDYEVEGQSYRGEMVSSGSSYRFYAPNDQVTVLYDEADPSKSCFVYRKAKDAQTSKDLKR